MVTQCEKCGDDVRPVEEVDVKYLHDLGLPILCNDCYYRREEDKAHGII